MPCGHAFCNGCWLDYFRIKARAPSKAPGPYARLEHAPRPPRWCARTLPSTPYNGLSAHTARRSGSLMLRCASRPAQIGDGQSRRATCMAVKCGAICDDTLVARLVASEPELVARCVPPCNDTPRCTA